MEDTAIPSMPNDKWSEDAIQLYNKLKELPGYFRRPDDIIRSDGSRHFLQAGEGKGMFFEYAFFINPSLHTMKGVVQFGMHTRGVSGCFVHGGAIAAILDSGCGTCTHGLNSLTAYLNINYLSPLPLNSTVLLEANVDKIEGRKIFLSSCLKSVDGSKTYATSTALFLQPKKSSL